VAGERGLDRDSGRLGVADLTEHHHVRVLPQQRPQGGAERHPDLVVYLHLGRDPRWYSIGSSTVLMFSLFPSRHRRLE
jgi:hypothetical protein